MFRTLTAAAVLALLSAFSVTSALAQTAPAPAKTTKKATAKKAAPAAEPISATNDNLNPNQLSLADRVLTGIASCEDKEKVDVEKIEGHSGNFKVVFAHKTYIMVPEETTTGAIRLVDTGGAVVWIQIPRKSMLKNQKEHHRLVDECQEDEQRIAVQSSTAASANAPFVAPSAATPTAAAAAKNGSLAVPATVAPATTTTTTTTTKTTTSVVPPAPVQRGAAAPDAAASGMWK